MPRLEREYQTGGREYPIEALAPFFVIMLALGTTLTVVISLGFLLEASRAAA